MEQQTTLISVLFEKSEQYLKTSAELYKLKAIEKSADVISSFTARVSIILLAVLCFLIFNIGVSLWIGEALGGSHYGFFIVSGFYALGALIIYLFREKWIIVPLKNLIITHALR